MNTVDMAIIWENHMIQKNIRNMVRLVFSLFNSQQMNFITNCSSIFLTFIFGALIAGDNLFAQIHT